MFLNERDTRLSDERRKDLQREAKQQRLAEQARRQPQRKDRKQSPLWTRVWSLL